MIFQERALNSFAIRTFRPGTIPSKPMFLISAREPIFIHSALGSFQGIASSLSSGNKEISIKGA